jgi:hypothetical protein
MSVIVAQALCRRWSWGSSWPGCARISASALEEGPDDKSMGTSFWGSCLPTTRQFPWAKDSRRSCASGVDVPDPWVQHLAGAGRSLRRGVETLVTLHDRRSWSPSVGWGSGSAPSTSSRHEAPIHQSPQERPTSISPHPLHHPTSLSLHDSSNSTIRESCDRKTHRSATQREPANGSVRSPA